MRTYEQVREDVIAASEAARRNQRWRLRVSHAAGNVIVDTFGVSREGIEPLLLAAIFENPTSVQRGVFLRVELEPWR